MDLQDFSEHSFGELEPGVLGTGDGASPSSPQLDKLMHQAMATVNNLLHDLEKDKGEKRKPNQTGQSSSAFANLTLNSV